jgi:hypothetical protein
MAEIGHGVMNDKGGPRKSLQRFVAVPQSVMVYRLA